MQKLKFGLMLLGVIGLSACGSFNAPSPTPDTRVQLANEAPPPMLLSNGTDWNKQGTIPACTDIGNSGAYPYSTGGPSWRQWAFINDGTTPNNYSTLTLTLPDPTKNALEPYTIDTGSTFYPDPFIYQEFNQDKLFLTGTLEGTTTPINKVYVYPGGSYGVVFRKNGDFYDIPILQKSVTSYKDFDQNGNIIKDAKGQPVVYSGNIWSYPTINGKAVRLLGNQTVKLEFYFSSSVYYKKHSVLTNYLDPVTNQIKSGWVVVDMPYQDAWVKITTDKYRLADTNTIISTNGQPLLAKIPFRGQINAPSPDRQSLLRSELWFRKPQGVSSMSGASFHTWLDQRKDAMLGWGFSNQRIGKATVGSNGELSNVTALQGPADWNLGDPSITNPNNCVSSTVQVTDNNFWIAQPQGREHGYYLTLESDTTDYFDTKCGDIYTCAYSNMPLLLVPASMDAEMTNTSGEKRARFKTRITPTRSGDHHFALSSPGQIDLYVNGLQIIDHSAINLQRSGKMVLYANQPVDVELVWHQYVPNTAVHLSWDQGTENVLAPLSFFQTHIQSNLSYIWSRISEDDLINYIPQPIYSRVTRIGDMFIVHLLSIDGSIYSYFYNDATQESFMLNELRVTADTIELYNLTAQRTIVIAHDQADSVNYIEFVNPRYTPEEKVQLEDSVRFLEDVEEVNEAGPQKLTINSDSLIDLSLCTACKNQEAAWNTTYYRETAELIQQGIFARNALSGIKAGKQPMKAISDAFWGTSPATGVLLATEQYKSDYTNIPGYGQFITMFAAAKVYVDCAKKYCPATPKMSTVPATMGLGQSKTLNLATLKVYGYGPFFTRVVSSRTGQELHELLIPKNPAFLGKTMLPPWMTFEDPYAMLHTSFKRTFEILFTETCPHSAKGLINNRYFEDVIKVYQTDPSSGAEKLVLEEKVEIYCTGPDLELSGPQLLQAKPSPLVPNISTKNITLKNLGSEQLLIDLIYLMNLNTSSAKVNIFESGVIMPPSTTKPFGVRLTCGPDQIFRKGYIQFNTNESEGSGHAYPMSIYCGAPWTAAITGLYCNQEYLVYGSFRREIRTSFVTSSGQSKTVLLRKERGQCMDEESLVRSYLPRAKAFVQAYTNKVGGTWVSGESFNATQGDGPEFPSGGLAILIGTSNP